jgi:hypothetical protein
MLTLNSLLKCRTLAVVASEKSDLKVRFASRKSVNRRLWSAKICPSQILSVLSLSFLLCNEPG